MFDDNTLARLEGLSNATSINQARQCLADILTDQSTISLEHGLRIARIAAQWREYETIAQVLVIALSQVSSAPDDGLIDEAADLLFDSLEKSNLSMAAAKEWTVGAFVKLRTASSVDSANLIANSVRGRTSVPTQTDQLSGLLQRSLTITVESPPRQRWSYAMVTAFAAVGLLALWLFAPPLSMPEFLGEFVPAPFWRAVIWIWLPLLLLSWVAMMLNATRSGARRFVPPAYLLGTRRIVAGRHQGFDSDIFFHLFAFIWVFLVGALALAEQKMPDILIVVSQASQASSADFLNLLVQASQGSIFDAWEMAGIPGLFFNTQFGYLAGIAVALWSLRTQSRIQTARIRSSIDIFWWDIRVGRPAFWIRWVMVGITMFFATVCVQKVGLFLTVFSASALLPDLPIELLHADGVAGMADLRDGLNINAWAAFVFGVLVMSSWYLHQGLSHYRWTDRAMGLVYLFIVISAVVVPFLVLHLKVEEAALIARDGLLNSVGGTDQLDPTSYLVRRAILDFEVNVFEIDALNSPVFILLFQSLILGFRSVRATKHRVEMRLDKWRVNETH